MARVSKVDSIDDIRRFPGGCAAIYFVNTPHRGPFQPSREIPVCHECAREAFGEDGNTVTVGAFLEGDVFYCDCGREVESEYGPV